MRPPRLVLTGSLLDVASLSGILTYDVPKKVIYAFRHSFLALIMNGPADAMLRYDKAPQQSSDTDKKVDDTSGDKCSNCEIDPNPLKKQLCSETQEKMVDMYCEHYAVGDKDALRFWR